MLCGQIHFTKQGEFLFNCIICSEQFTKLQLFITHFFNLHAFISNNNNEISEDFENILTNNNNQYIIQESNVLTLPKLGILCDASVNIKKSNSSLSNDQKYIIKNDHMSIKEKKINLLPEADHHDDNLEIEQEEFDNNENDSNFKNKQNIMLMHANSAIINNAKEVNRKNAHRRKLNNWQCDICNYICKKGPERKEHERTHKGVKRLICETCGKGYTKKNRLDDHIRTHTGERPFKCRFCPKTFTSHSSMRSHDRTHIGFKPFKCNFCDQMFKTKNNQLIHENKHHVNINRLDTDKTTFIVLKPFECILCGKRFRKDAALIAHIQKHTNQSKDKPYECSQCPSTFVNKIYLNAHERLYHRGEFNYKCDYCDKVFLKFNKKKQHEEMHTRIENSYGCDLCEKKYARKEGLAKHRKIHHTPFKCDICLAIFASQSVFREHCKQHNIVEKQFGCEYCEARFDIEIRLARHLKKMHNTTMHDV